MAVRLAELFRGILLCEQLFVLVIYQNTQIKTRAENRRRNLQDSPRKLTAAFNYADVSDYPANGIFVSLTPRRNTYSRIFQNISLFRNKVNRTHPTISRPVKIYPCGSLCRRDVHIWASHLLRY